MSNFLKAGTKQRETPLLDGVEPYIGSMAEAMEKAFKKEWPVIMRSAEPVVNDHLRLIFIAIAQGVIKHLKDNKEAITVRVPNMSGSGTQIRSLENVNTEGKLH